MQIRNKLTLQFSAIVAIILILFSISIFYISEHFRNKNFNNRLKEKAINTANLLLEVEEINVSLLKTIRRDYLASLPEEFVRVYENTSTPIYRDDTISFRLTPEQLEMVRKEGEVKFSHGDRQVVGISYKDKYRITASARDLDGHRQMTDLKHTLLLGNIICLVIIFATGKFFSIQALKPITKITKEAENINENNLGLRLDEGQRKDEISQLSITFNKLFDRLQDAFERQKQFVSNASHELRTPLTTITGEIEVALMKRRSQEEYIEVLLSLLDEAKTLTKLSNGLLQLAQSSDSKTLSIERINVFILIERIKEEISRRYEKNALPIVFNETVPLSHIEVNGNEDLLKIALVNLIDNGFKFSYNKPVCLSIELTEQDVVLKVIDHGIGISGEDLVRISQPFFRAENVLEIPGHGIGLSLTERIIKLHGGSIHFKSEPAKGTIISISLPRLNYESN